MKNRLEVISHPTGSKPNMQLGEVRYYPQDNPNIIMDSVREISSKTMGKIFNCLFEDFLIEVNAKDGRLECIKYDLDSPKYITNKAYICVKEATTEHDGMVIHNHDGYVLVYAECVISQ